MLDEKVGVTTVTGATLILDATDRETTVTMTEAATAGAIEATAILRIVDVEVEEAVEGETADSVEAVIGGRSLHHLHSRNVNRHLTWEDSCRF